MTRKPRRNNGAAAELSPCVNATAQRTSQRIAKPRPARLALRIRFEAARVSGRYPPAVRDTARMRMKIRSRPIPVSSSSRKAYAHPGAVTKRNLRHVSAGAPVVAHTGGKSFALSSDCQTETLANLQPQQLVEPAVE